MTRRKSIHAYVDDDSWTGWQTYADQLNVSVTALVEAIGLQLADLASGKHDLLDPTEAAMAAARITRQRRRRQGYHASNGATAHV